jgi:hypothetical protein
MKIAEVISTREKQSLSSRSRKVQRRETELDPQKPIKPITVAEPTKPKKPKYKGI